MEGTCAGDLGCPVTGETHLKASIRSAPRAATVLLFLLSSVPPDGWTGARPRTGHTQQAQLGEVNFPTGCLDSVQATMENGLALLHSFEYQEAEEAFQDASRRDPECALAYWGKAMALYQSLWDFPSAGTLARGRQDVEEARKRASGDARIGGYVEAAAAFYQPANLGPVARVLAYSSAMEKLYRNYPQDHEAGELYALSLISLEEMGVDAPANRKKAIRILNPIFQRYPRDPGAAHYLVHATDARGLATEGLAAAKAYATIAPRSAHALHMPSHIFRRLGMWQPMIEANLASASVAAEAERKLEHSRADYQFHAMDFLDYAYLQSGQEAKARELVAALENVPEAAESDIVDAQNRFAARNALELHRWKEAAGLAIPTERLAWQDYTYWTRAIGAARSGDAEGARADVEKLVEIARQIKSQTEKNQSGMPPMGMAIDPGEAAGWLAYAEGKPDQAVAILRSAAEREEARDDEPFATPAREMLADLFLLLSRPQEALSAYKDVLKYYPNRFNALNGAAQAADASGDRPAAVDFYRELLRNCPPNADRPELGTAREYLAANQKEKP
jgi:Tetratricopeptide repeat